MLQKKGLWFVIAMLLLAACSPQTTQSFASLPAGDATRGEVLFNEPVNGSPNCSACHSSDGTSKVGPSLQGIAAIAATRKEGMAAGDYIYESIVKPAAYIVERYSNTMYTQYRSAFRDQNLADLIAYLMTLE
jgi:cytochrome c2